MHPLQWLCLLTLLGAFAALMWFVLGGPSPRRARLFRDLPSFQRAVQGRLDAGLPASAFKGVAFTGELPGGRRARITIQQPLHVKRTDTRSGTSPAPRVRATVSAAQEVPELRLRREGLGGALSRAFEREDVRPADLAGQVGRQDVFTAPGSAASRRYADLDAGLRAALDGALTDLGVEQLALRPGELVAEAPLGACPPGRFDELLAALERAAQLTDATPPS